MPLPPFMVYLLVGLLDVFYPAASLVNRKEIASSLVRGANVLERRVNKGKGAGPPATREPRPRCFYAGDQLSFWTQLPLSFFSYLFSTALQATRWARLSSPYCSS